MRIWRKKNNSGDARDKTRIEVQFQGKIPPALQEACAGFALALDSNYEIPGCVQVILVKKDKMIPSDEETFHEQGDDPDADGADAPGPVIYLSADHFKDTVRMQGTKNALVEHLFPLPYKLTRYLLWRRYPWLATWRFFRPLSTWLSHYYGKKFTVEYVVACKIFGDEAESKKGSDSMKNIMEQAGGGTISYDMEREKLDAPNVGTVVREDEEGLLLAMVRGNGKADGVEYVRKRFISRIEFGSRAAATINRPSTRKKYPVIPSAADGDLLPSLIELAMKDSDIVSISPWNTEYDPTYGVIRSYDRERESITVEQYLRNRMACGTVILNIAMIARLRVGGLVAKKIRKRMG
jgi:hypothetical protein